MKGKKRWILSVNNNGNKESQYLIKTTHSANIGILNWLENLKNQSNITGFKGEFDFFPKGLLDMTYPPEEVGVLLLEFASILKS